MFKFFINMNSKCGKNSVGPGQQASDLDLNYFQKRVYKCKEGVYGQMQYTIFSHLDCIYFGQ